MNVSNITYSSFNSYSEDIALISYSKSFNPLNTVVPTKKDVSLTGMPEEVEPGTEVELTCSVNRIKPEVLKMVWNTTIGQRQDEKVTKVQNKDGTYQCKSVVKYEWVKIFSDSI